VIKPIHRPRGGGAAFGVFSGIARGISFFAGAFQRFTANRCAVMPRRG